MVLKLSGCNRTGMICMTVICEDMKNVHSNTKGYKYKHVGNSTTLLLKYARRNRLLHETMRCQSYSRLSKMLYRPYC